MNKQDFIEEMGWEEPYTFTEEKKRLNKLLSNYISKEQILNLECLKDEKDREQRGSSIDYNFDVEIRNQLRKEIKEEINKDLFKDFKQVSNPLDPYDKP